MILLFDGVVKSLWSTHGWVLDVLVIFSVFILDLIDIILSVFDVIRIVGLFLPLLLINSRHIVRLRLKWIPLH